MHGGKALLIIAVVALVVLSAVMFFFPNLRPGFVQGWMHKAGGYTEAKSADDALDKFKQAIEKRDYKAASLYLSGDYKEWFDKGTADAEAMHNAIDNLRHAMNARGVKSDKAEFVLFALEPFPGGFKYTTSGSSESATAKIRWDDDIARYKNQAGQHFGWNVDNRILNSLLPKVVTGAGLAVNLKKEKDGWRIQIPVETTGRHMRDTVDYLRKNGSNFKNAITSLGNDVKNDSLTKENFEQSLKTKLEQSK